MSKLLVRLYFNGRSTVSFSSIQVLLCETRQAVNKYGLRGVCSLIGHYKRSVYVRREVASLRKELTARLSMKQSHTVLVLERIRVAVGMSICDVRAAHGIVACSRHQLVYSLGSLRLCPKVCLEAIPEWICLRRSMSVCLCRAQRNPRYCDLVAACRELGITSRGSAARISKASLRRAFNVRMKKSSALKRSWHEVAQDVSDAGGSPVYYQKSVGKRRKCRMSIRDMEAFLVAHARENL